MNVFILCTGRSGSMTIVKACQHITNYTADHESKGHRIGAARFDFPDNHIEADNRLSWFLGNLDKYYGDNAFYVHLRRPIEDTAMSFYRRWGMGIIQAYEKAILSPFMSTIAGTKYGICLDFCKAVNNNIELFMKDKTLTMNFCTENMEEDFITFWDVIGAEGDLDAALETLNIRFNPSTNLDDFLLKIHKFVEVPKRYKGDLNSFYRVQIETIFKNHKLKLIYKEPLIMAMQKHDEKEIQRIIALVFSEET